MSVNDDYGVPEGDHSATVTPESVVPGPESNINHKSLDTHGIYVFGLPYIPPLIPPDCYPWDSL